MTNRREDLKIKNQDVFKCLTDMFINLYQIGQIGALNSLISYGQIIDRSRGEDSFSEDEINFLKSTPLNQIDYIVSEVATEPCFSIRNRSTNQEMKFSNRLANCNEFRGSAFRNRLDAFTDKNQSLHDALLTYGQELKNNLRNRWNNVFKQCHQIDMANDQEHQSFINYMLQKLEDCNLDDEYLNKPVFKHFFKLAYDDFFRTPAPSTIEEILPGEALTTVQGMSLCSDHEPLVSQTTVTDAKGKHAAITVLTYNTLNNSRIFPGFKWPDGWDYHTVEDLIRLQNITNRIRTIAESRQCNLICLQETSEEFRIKIVAALNKDAKDEVWGLLAGDGNRAVLYKKSAFELGSNQKKNPECLKTNGNPSNGSFCGGQLTIKGLENKTLTVFSLHTSHDEDPTELQNAIKAVGQEFSNDTVLLGCDCNRRIAYLGSDLRDNANNLIPTYFRNSGNNGMYDSTDVCIKIEKGIVEQLSGTTPDPRHPEMDVLRDPILGLERKDNPYRYVMNAEMHHLPVGKKGMNTLEFAKELQNSADAEATPQCGLFVAPRTNEKYFRIFSNNRIPLLDEMGLNHNTLSDSDMSYYDIEFAYPDKIQSDYTAQYDTDTDKTFFVRVNGEIKRCSLDGSHRIQKEKAKDIGIIAGSIAGATGIGSSVGAVLGTFVFPGLGTAAGAVIGGVFGVLTGMAVSGLQGIIRSRLFGGLDNAGESVAAGFLTILGTSGIGALIGTLLLPGIGTLIGVGVGLAVGALTAVLTGVISNNVLTNKSSESVIKANESQNSEGDFKEQDSFVTVMKQLTDGKVEFSANTTKTTCSESNKNMDEELNNVNKLQASNSDEALEEQPIFARRC